MPNELLSQIDRVSITSFNGMDASRSPVVNQEYNIGQLAVNIGRRQRQPFQARLCLRPVTSENGNHLLSGHLFAMGVLSGGTRLSIIARLSGARLVAATGVTVVPDGE